MNAIVPLSAASFAGQTTSAVLARLLADAFEGLDGDIERVRASLARAVALVDGAAAPAGVIARGGLAPWQVGKVLALIEASLERGVRICELADSARLSPSHFSRAFKARFGRSPHRYILERRIARAQQLMLARQAEPLCDVALACGFTDQAHLSRMFRRLTGEAPNAWRRARLAAMRA